MKYDALSYIRTAQQKSNNIMYNDLAIIEATFSIVSTFKTQRTYTNNTYTQVHIEGEYTPYRTPAYTHHHTPAVIFLVVLDHCG